MCAECCGTRSADPTVLELDFETLLSDPLIRLVMQSDGVSPDELEAVLRAAGRARAAAPVHPLA